MARTSVAKIHPQANFSISKNFTLANGLITYIDVVTGRDFVNDDRLGPVGAGYLAGKVQGVSFGRGPVKIRGFGSTYGTGGGSDIVQATALKAGLPLARTYCIWTYLNTIGAGNTRIWHIGDAGYSFLTYFDATYINIFRTDASSIIGAWGIAVPPLTTWFCLGISQDGTTANPTVYVNGVPQTLTVSVALTNIPAVINEEHAIGNRASLFDRQMDGMCGDLVGWGRVLSAKEHWEYYINSWNIMKSNNPIQMLNAITGAPPTYKPGLWPVFI